MNHVLSGTTIPCCSTSSKRGIVGQLGEEPRVGSTVSSSTGTTVVRRCVGVVGRVGAVTEDQYEGCEIAYES